MILMQFFAGKMVYTLNTDPFLHCIYTVLRLLSNEVSIYIPFFLCLLPAVLKCKTHILTVIACLQWRPLSISGISMHSIYWPAIYCS